MLTGPPRLVSAITIFLLLVLVWWYFQLVRRYVPLTYHHSPSPKTPWEAPSAPPKSSVDPLDFSIPIKFQPGNPKPPGSNYSRVLVLPKTSEEEIGWIHAELPDLPLAVYEVDNATAQLRVPKNKGREAMVYLTYLIDHYDDLPDTILFFHSHRYAWHNNILMGLDSAQAIKRLNDARVARMGYMNTRCHQDPGCPDWIHMDRPAIDFDFFRKPEEIYYRKSVWEELHPGAPIPPTLSQPCCAQFAVSRERVRQVPRERFIHYRKWLLDTSLDDQYSGRVFEYIWQYVFTGNAVYCPSANSCYCDGYGICFGGAVKYAEWFAIMDERNKLYDELNVYNNEKKEAEDKGKKFEATKEAQEKMKELEDKIHKLDPQMEKLRSEAFKRGEDPKSREMETETYDDTHIWDNMNHS